MLITRGLGSGLLVTAGYGGLGVLLYPYCPDITKFTSAPVLVQVLTSPFSKAPSVTVTAQPTYVEVLSPYSVTAGVLVDIPPTTERTAQVIAKSTDVISNTPTPHTELPKGCS